VEISCSPLGSAPSLTLHTPKIKVGYKGLPQINTLAYFLLAVSDGKVTFCKIDATCQVIKLFSSSLRKDRNKLEC
jgi:hypothetical protein